jgi:hypothetical protein
MAKKFPQDFLTRGAVAAADKLLIANNTGVCKFTTVEELLDVLSSITIDAPTFTGVTTVERLNINGTDLTASAVELNTLDGITASVAELNFCDGVTSAIQTQLDLKADADDIGDFATNTALALKANIASPVFTGAVTIGGTSPHANALLDLTSTAKALIVPRMTTTQRDAMTGTAGMIIYNSTTGQFEGYISGSGWWMFTMHR